METILEERSQDAINLIASCISVGASNILFKSESTLKLKRTPSDKPPIEDRLSSLIYTRCYLKVSGADVVPSKTNQLSNGQLADDLIACMPRTRNIDWTWYYRDVNSDSTIVATRDDRVVVLSPGSYLYGPKAFSLFNTGRIGLLESTISFGESDDWLIFCYRLFGKTRSNSEIRIYFNVCAQGAVVLTSALISSLTKWEIPFAFKCPGHALNFRRRDSAVLYIDRRDLYPTLSLIASAHPSFSNFLRSDIPLFTYPLLAGIGMAETPIAGGSFGMSRSKSCARALLSIKRRSTQLERSYALRKQFESEGVSMKALYRNPGDSYPYEHSLIREIMEHIR